MSSALRSGSVLALALVGLAACDIGSQRPAMGEANGVIAIAMDSLWAQVEDSARAALEPRIFTVRDEKAFEVTHVSPLDTLWLTYQGFRELLVIGRASDPWIANLLEAPPPAELPAIAVREDVWARNQRVTVVALPETNEAAALTSILSRVADQNRQNYLVYARTRMFVSGADVGLQDTLEAEGGFSMLFPQVYDWERVGDAFVFRNHSELTGTVNRTFLVQSRPGVPDSLAVEALLAWRDTAVAGVFHPRQSTKRERIESRRLEGWPGQALQAQGIWSTDMSDGYPSAGPFITRVYVCPSQNRTYLVDAWLYAPAVSKPKYEYMIQLETLLDTFRCGGTAQAEQPLADA